jgi:hypothetical protein
MTLPSLLEWFSVPHLSLACLSSFGDGVVSVGRFKDEHNNLAPVARGEWTETRQAREEQGGGGKEQKEKEVGMSWLYSLKRKSK